MHAQERIEKEFHKLYGESPTYVVHAPGRINLIGDHTDYNDGFVLPIALPKKVWIGLRPRQDRTIQLHSINFDEPISFSLDQLQREIGWAEYIKGVAWSLSCFFENTPGTLPCNSIAPIAAFNQLRGWEGIVFSDFPTGSGLASSAALEVATLRAFQKTSSFAVDPVDQAHICQTAENEWVGMNCGIMDQMAAAVARPGEAVFIDCRSLETEVLDLPGDARFVVMDTNTKRELVNSEYNARREGCRQAAKAMDLKSLRDATMKLLESHKDNIPQPFYQYAKFVIEENERVRRAVKMLKRHDLLSLGKLMNESHSGLRDEYSVSTFELDTIVECARANDGCYGARLTGAGFGGSAIALVRAEVLDRFIQSTPFCYEQMTGVKPNIF